MSIKKMLILIIVLSVVLSFLLPVVNAKKLNATTCTVCKFDCILPNGYKGARIWIGEWVYSPYGFWYCQTYSPITQCMAYC